MRKLIAKWFHAFIISMFWEFFGEEQLNEMYKAFGEDMVRRAKSEFEIRFTDVKKGKIRYSAVVVLRAGDSEPTVLRFHRHGSAQTRELKI